LSSLRYLSASARAEQVCMATWMLLLQRVIEGRAERPLRPVWARSASSARGLRRPADTSTTRLRRRGSGRLEPWYLRVRAA
jgi:hypothetical protein